MLGSPSGTSAWQWRPSGGAFDFGAGIKPLGYWVHDGNTGFSLNVSIASTVGTTIRAIREGEYIILGNQGSNDGTTVVKGKLETFSLEEGKEGQKVDQVEFTPPSTAGNVSVSLTGVYPDDGVICFEASKLLKRWGYSLDTGALLWESDPEPQMNYYSMYDNYYKGMLLSPSWGGVILAYNITTGDIIWNYTASNVGWESPYGNYPINIFAICDDKIYTLTGEHSISQPMYRGPNLRCINATTGEEIFKILMFSANGGASLGGQYAQLADGHILALNFFDNEIYCFGKGPSATTVTASPKVSVHGTSVIVEGTITDQTPTGRRNTNDMFDFSLKGTPAISDEDQAAWMEYMFMQQARPENAKGVEVILETLDPNGNFYEIGKTTSDINGNYAYMFTPDVPGEYQILARFEGSKAYGPSYASTYLGVDEAPQATPTPTPPPPSTADVYLMPATIGIIVAIAVVGLVIILMLRKR
jgi:outer membrane protein assembly factor BamB